MDLDVLHIDLNAVYIELDALQHGGIDQLT